MKRTDLKFEVRGLKCAAWLYQPDNAANPPVVIMAHGLGAEREFGLAPFAEKFCAKGLAVFVFDYRNFGDSEGEPRNLISPRRHVQDWQAALDYVRGMQGVNTKKIGLWGTSFSGGHVLVTAAKHPEISAVVAQVPFVDGISSSLIYSPEYILKASIYATRDIFRMITFRSPFYVKVISTPDEFAIMNTPESMQGYLALIPKDSAWKNQAPARIFATLPVYRPISYASKIKSPVLIIYGEKDSLIPPAGVRKTAARIQNVKLVSLPVGHFDVYTGDLFNKVSDIEADFLVERLAGPE